MSKKSGWGRVRERDDRWIEGWFAGGKKCTPAALREHNKTIDTSSSCPSASSSSAVSLESQLIWIRCYPKEMSLFFKFSNFVNFFPLCLATQPLQWAWCSCREDSPSPLSLSLSKAPSSRPQQKYWNIKILIRGISQFCCTQSDKDSDDETIRESATILSTR